MAIRNGLDVKGITTLSGNTNVDQVTENVLRVLHFAERDDIPVFKGASRPLVSELIAGAPVHGRNGLGDVELPPANRTYSDIPAPEAIYKIARENPGVILITIGPLTNVAIAINLYPELKNLIGEIVSMGGALYKGNVTRFAEFNFYFDPEAVQFVFDSNIPLTIVPWDPILENVILEEELIKLMPEDSKIGKLILELEKTPIGFMERFYGVRASVFPDPFAVAYVIDRKVAKNIITGNMKMELNYNTMRGASVLTEGDRMKIITAFNFGVFKNILVKTVSKNKIGGV
jgi:inosine-uridine nucleoside N-ribohydrolase